MINVSSGNYSRSFKTFPGGKLEFNNIGRGNTRSGESGESCASCVRGCNSPCCGTYGHVTPSVATSPTRSSSVADLTVVGNQTAIASLALLAQECLCFQCIRSRTNGHVTLPRDWSLDILTFLCRVENIHV